MTTHRERMKAAIQGELLDRPPVALWRHFPVDDQESDTLAAAQLAFQTSYDFDLVKISPASSYSVRDWGVEDEWEGNTEGTRTYKRLVVREPGDWERLSILQPTSPHFEQQLDCIRQLRSRLGPETPLLQTVFNPLAQAKHLAGEQTLLQHLRTHPDALRRGLEIIAETTREFIRAAAAAGADGIFYAIQHAQARLLSREEFLSLSRDLDIMLLQAGEGLWCNVIHLHGEGVFLDAVLDYPAQILNWHDRESGPTLNDAAELWPGVVCGGLSRQTLVYATAGDVAREAEDAILSRKGRRLVLSTGCVVPIIAPHGNLAAARVAADRWPGKSARTSL